MKKSVLLSLILLSVLVGTAVFAEENQEERKDWDVIKICHLQWGNLTGKHLKNKGFYMDTFAKVFKQAGYQVKTYIYPWRRCLDNTRSEKMDMVAPSWLIDPIINGIMMPPPIFPAFFTQTHLITSDLSIQDSRPEALKGRKFAGPARDSLPLTMQKTYYPIFKKTLQVAKQEQSFQMLLNKRIDVVFTTTEAFLSWYKKLPPHEQKPYKILKPAIQNIPAAPLLTKNSVKPERQKKFIKAYNKAYREMCLQGALHQILIDHSVVDEFKTTYQDPDFTNWLGQCNMMLKDPKNADNIMPTDFPTR